MDVGRVRPLASQEDRFQRRLSSSTAPTAGARSSTAKRRSSGAARKQRWPEASFASSGAGSPTRRSIPLGPANTPFSLVYPERRLSQPTVRATMFFGSAVGRRLHAVGHRQQPLPKATTALASAWRRATSSGAAASAIRRSRFASRARSRRSTGPLTSLAGSAAGRHSCRDSPPMRGSAASTPCTPRSCRSAGKRRRLARTGGSSARASCATAPWTSPERNERTATWPPLPNISGSGRSTAPTTSFPGSS